MKNFNLKVNYVFNYFIKFHRKKNYIINNKLGIIIFLLRNFELSQSQLHYFARLQASGDSRTRFPRTYGNFNWKGANKYTNPPILYRSTPGRVRFNKYDPIRRMIERATNIKYLANSLELPIQRVRVRSIVPIEPRFGYRSICNTDYVLSH